IQTGLDFRVTAVIETEEEAEQYLHILQSEQEDAAEVENVALEYQAVYKALRENTDWKLADTWTAAFFIQKDDLNKMYPTNLTLQNIKQGNAIDEDLEDEILRLARKYRFFHWHLEYPEVFEKGGFNCILVNPPWERVKLQEKEFFSNKSDEIATAATKKIREELISNLKISNPELKQSFEFHKDFSERIAQFSICSNLYPILGKGDVNLYQLFAENFLKKVNDNGHAGIIVPTNIVTDDTTKEFFEYIVVHKCLISLFDFENKKELFKNVHREQRFSLLSMSRYANLIPVKFAFYLHLPEELLKEERIFELKHSDIISLNPNTKNCPIFKEKHTIDIALKIYKNSTILVDDMNGIENFNCRPWSMFHMTNDSNYFEFSNDYGDLLPLYEGKHTHIFDHRYNTFKDVDENDRKNGNSRDVSISEHENVKFEIHPRFFIHQDSYEEKLKNISKPNFWLTFHGISNPNNERTFISTIIPSCPTGNSMPVFIFNDVIENKAEIGLLLCSNFNTFIYDFVCRMKMGSRNINFFIIKQLPLINIHSYPFKVKNKIVQNGLKLSFTSFSLQEFASDAGFEGEPFRWNDEERFKLKCELDAIYGHLYGLTRGEFDYILETFPIVKRKDMEKYGTYRTKDTILQLYDEMDWVKEEMEKTKTEKLN
ncbi:MAG: hypothetical protein GX807_02935, partial [Erysipelotrichia bacterium]|nr:hypothetical protein [Erysipelotrichia bacterium]